MKNLSAKILLAVLGLAMSFAVQAQTIKGVVTDSTGEPLIGVSVMEKGTQNGVITGIDGDYAINIQNPEGKTLEFSYIGMSTQEIVIGKSDVINVVMNEDNTFLEETVVIGYATVKRRDLIGSVSSVDNNTLTAVPVASVSEALTGKMAGVQVTTTEGDPDADVKIRVRGTGSITQDSSPLYIVDGFPVESISDIPSADIQSIDVLKDAFSTAIYGSRGANGVVLVTTKSGKDGKVSVSYNGYYGLKKMANAGAVKVLDPYEYVKTQYEIESIRGKVNESYVPMFGTFGDLDLYQGLEGNDWVNQIFGHTGSSMNHNVSVTGGSDKVKWTASYNLLTDNAIMSGSSFVRNNIAFKTQYKPIKQLTIDFNLRYSNTEVLGSGSNSINDAGSTSGTSARLKHAVQYTPIPVTGATSDSDLEEDYGDNAPPLQSVKDNDKKRIRKNWTMNAGVTWHIIKNLNLRVEGGLDEYSQEDNNFYGLTTYYVGNSATIKNQPATIYKNNFRNKYRNTNTLNYNFEEILSDDRHHLDLLIGQETIVTKSNLLSQTIEGLPVFFDSNMAWNFMASGTPISGNNYYYPDDMLVSVFSRANYDFDRRYSFSATVRGDGSSKFTKGNQWGVFPSAAASWTISNEEFMEEASWIDNLKLRYTYGTAGNNNIPAGVSSMLFQANNSTWISQGNTYWSTTKVDGKTIMPNSNLTWETTVSNNLGLDFSLFRTRLNGSVEVYNNDTRNLLIQFPTSGTGYDYQYRNMGTINNKGLEFSLNAVLIEKKNAGLTIGGNISVNKNKVVSLGGLEKIEAESLWASTEIGPDYIVLEGQPLGNIYGYVCDGRYGVNDFTYDPDKKKWNLNEGIVNDKAQIGENYLRPGALKLKGDENGNPVKEIIGNAIPVGSGGFYINGNVCGFDFSANFNYVFGNQIYNANKVEFTSSRKYSRRNLISSMATDKRWTNINWDTGELVTDPDQLAAMNAGTTMWSPGIGNAVLTDWAIEDGSFVRLSNLTIGYSLPESFIKKFHCQKLRVYVTGNNLFCLTRYSGYDPEVDTRRSTPLTPGVDYSAYPKSRGFVGGINITF